MSNPLTKSLVAGVLVLGLSTPVAANDADSLVREFYTIVDAKAERLDRFYANDFKDHDRSPVAPKDATDKQVILSFFSELLVGFPDFSHELEILAPIGYDKAMVYWAFEGTHTGTFFGNQATGNKISINGVDIFRIKGGKFVEQWHVEELMSLFGQMRPES
ncbi:MAG: ester cyclase [Gammaproteobacteria bacterium]|nr:ester cyclase [Gammaproteobacteria bacterium]